METKSVHKEDQGEKVQKDENQLGDKRRAATLGPCGHLHRCVAERLGSAAQICCHVAGRDVRRMQQLAPWPAEPEAALAAHDAAAAELRCRAAAAAAVQRQLGMAYEPPFRHVTYREAYL